MKSKYLRCCRWMPLFSLPCLLAGSATTWAADSPTAAPNSGDNADKTTSQGARPSDTTQPPEAAQTPNKNEAATAAAGDTPPPSKDWTLKAGTDFYRGYSNLNGFRHYQDGFWAGFGPAYPSVVYGHATKGDGSEAKLSLGVGNLYGGAGMLVNEPVEGWYKAPLGKTNLTVGKFYVPFALQEWEYETKYGVMLDRTVGQTSFTGAINTERHHDLNGYFRAGHNFSKHLNVGLSLGAGRGVSFGTVQNRGGGLDATITTSAWQFVTENLLFTRHSGERFNFDFGKLTYQKLGKWKPYLSKYTWHDQVGVLGNFHSTVYGLNYQLTPEIAIEGAYANAPGKTVHWIQIHITGER